MASRDPKLSVERAFIFNCTGDPILCHGMSDKQKFPRAQALVVATQLMANLRPFCERIEIAGSLRRSKAEVGDIELLFIPKMLKAKEGLFDTALVDQAAAAIDRMVAERIISPRKNVAGHISAWGPLNKLALHLPSGIPVDFFSTTADNWWVSLVIRTGSKEMNLLLTTGSNRLNRTLHAYGAGITDRRTGELMPAKNEREVFWLCGVPYREPKDR